MAFNNKVLHQLNVTWGGKRNGMSLNYYEQNSNKGSTLEIWLPYSNEVILKAPKELN